MAIEKKEPARRSKEELEEEEIKRIMAEEEAVVKTAQEATRAEAAKAAVSATLPSPPSIRSVVVGDVMVCPLREELFCCLGGRHYALKKGQTIAMDHNHAEELRQIGVVELV